jgi:NDP-sugar pyrophosphorylase family protein
MKIEGIILAAGRGTRMLPLTDHLPKPLLPVMGTPLLGIIAEKLLAAGASRLHVNLFHLGAMIREYAGGRGWPVVFHEEGELLDTGGGIGNMADGLRNADQILLHNGDILSSFGFEEALRFHAERKALVTMILMGPGEGVRTPPPTVTLDGAGSVTGIGRSLHVGPVEDGPGVLGYTGMAVISGRALGYFPREKRGLVPVLLEMIARMPGSVAGFDATSTGSSAWGEIGSPASYLDMHRRIMLEMTRFDGAVPPPPLPLRAGDGSSIDPGAEWKGFLDVGDGARIEGNTFLEDCVVMENAVVRSGSRLRSAIIFNDEVLEVEK